MKDNVSSKSKPTGSSRRDFLKLSKKLAVGTMACGAVPELRWEGDRTMHMKSDAPRDITGSWIVKVIPDPATGIPPMTNFATMTKDGALIGSNQKGLAHNGVWGKTSDHAYSATFQGFEESDGQLIRYQVRSTFELSGDKEHFGGPFITDVFDLDGNLLSSVRGTVSADRMHLEPLE